MNLGNISVLYYLGFVFFFISTQCIKMSTRAQPRVHRKYTKRKPKKSNKIKNYSSKSTKSKRVADEESIWAQAQSKRVLTPLHKDNQTNRVFEKPSIPLPPHKQQNSQTKFQMFPIPLWPSMLVQESSSKGKEHDITQKNPKRTKKKDHTSDTNGQYNNR